MMFISLIIILFMKSRNLFEIQTTHLATCYHELGVLKKEKKSFHLKKNWVNNQINN